jgi:hypothetical protein
MVERQPRGSLKRCEEGRSFEKGSDFRISSDGFVRSSLTVENWAKENGTVSKDWCRLVIRTHTSC